MINLHKNNLEREFKDIPSRRNPLDPVSQNKPSVKFLLITYKHIENLPRNLTYFFNILTIISLISALIAEKSSSDIIYKLSSIQTTQIPFLILVATLNIAVFVFFLITKKFKKIFLTRKNASSQTKLIPIFTLLAILIKIFYNVIFPFQVIITLLFVRCKRLEDKEGFCSSLSHKIHSGIFIINLLFSIFYIILYQMTLVGTFNNRDPASTTISKKIDIFQVVLLLVETIQHIPNWDPGNEKFGKKLAYGTCFALIFFYQIYFRSSDALFDRKTRTIYYLGLGMVSWTLFRQFVWSLVSSFISISEKFKNLILILELSIWLKIFLNRLEMKNFKFILRHEKSLFDKFTGIQKMLILTEKLILKKDNSNKIDNDLELIRLKGVYKTHQRLCRDLSCTCNHHHDKRYGDNNLLRFRDFFLREIFRVVQRYPNNFYIRYYYVLYILKYQRNLSTLTAQLHNLKPLIRNSFLKSLRYLELEIMTESLFKDVYKGRKKIDGLEISSIGEEALEDISTSESLKNLIKGDFSGKHLELVSFIEIDRIFNNMLDRMRDSIDVHQIFVGCLQKRNASLKLIHELVQSLAKLHKIVDREFLNLKKIVFKYTTFHLLPYGLFKNQTQNGVRECNLILKKFRSKVKTSRKIFLKLEGKIENINLEEDSVCFLFSMSEEDFMNIFYVTRSSERVFGASVSFDQANLVDILPHSTSDIHQEIVKNYLKNLQRKYFSDQKTGLISVKEHLYEQVSYIVSLYPSTVLRPMLITYVKKQNLGQNRYMFVLDSSGVIEGCSGNLIHIYPDIKGLIGKKIEVICKGIKTDIDHFRFYALVMKKSQEEVGNSFKWMGFRKSNLKKYKKDWEGIIEY